MMTLLETTYQILAQQRLVLPGEPVVVGVSGGADSLALLHILQALRSTLMVDIHAATLDHGLRGPIGASDARYVADLCHAWEIPVTVGAITTADLDDENGIEHAARRARYNFLAQVARTIGAHTIAVAHHADDQVETILMHLLRGSGLQGLTGMTMKAPMPEHPDLILIRPLLSIAHQDLIHYCQQHHIQPRDDATNQDTRWLRNRLRLETLPYLRQINPQINRALQQLGTIADTHHDYIRQQLQRAITGHITITEGRLSLDRVVYRTLHKALQQEFILWATGQLTSETVGFEHVFHAAEFAQHERTGQRIHLPGKLRLRLDYDQIILEKVSAPSTPIIQPHLNPGTNVVLNAPGQTLIPGTEWRFLVSTSQLPTGEHPPLRLNASLQATMSLRTRKPGDRFAPLGLAGHTQKLKKWMIDHKVPLALRDQIPILTIDDQIAALFVDAQWIINEYFAVHDEDQPSLYFQFIKRPSEDDVESVTT